MTTTGVPFVAAVDWGTTRLRVWLIDSDGAVISERRSDEGLMTTGPKEFEAALERHLAALGAAATLPAIVCGMAGSRQGWVEAPYRTLPVLIDEALDHAMAVPGVRRPVFIIPGLAGREAFAPDVMRGEETQIAGVAHLLGDRPMTVCLPGTHSKWVEIADGEIIASRTFLTGELFALISSHSILRLSLPDTRRAVRADDPAFRDWCQSAIAAPDALPERLFQIRAAALLHGLSRDDAEAALSGLLIGSEIGAARRAAGQDVVLVASGAIADLYDGALALGGFRVTRADAEEAVRAGLLRAARRLFGADGERRRA